MYTLKVNLLLEVRLYIRGLYWLSKVHRHRKVKNIGGPRFRILVVGGGQGGPNSQQAHVVVLTSMRRNDVTSTSFRRHVPTRFLINQCQIITFLTVKSDNIDIEEFSCFT